MKIGCVTDPVKVHNPEAAAEQAGERRTLESQGGGQRNVGKISGPRDADLGVGGDQELLGLPDIRAALQKRGGKPGGNLRRMRLRGEFQCRAGSRPDYFPAGC